MSVVELASGRILFREGDASRHIYRVVSGEIEVSRGTGDRAAVLGRVGPGHFVGEMGALVSARRNGTARAVSDTVLRRYRRREFLLEVVRDPELSAQVLNGLSLRTRAQVEFLRGSPARKRTSLFRRIVEWLRSLLKRAPRQGPLRAAIGRSGFGRQEFEPGAVLFEESAASDGVFWIESGRVHVRTKDAGGAERRAGHAGAGEFVGEMGVLESLPRSATAVAATRVVACKMSPEDFTALLRRSPSAVLAVIDALCERARRTRARAAAWDGSGNLLDALRSVDSMAQLAQHRIVDEAHRAHAYVAAQWDRGKVMSATYQNYLRGTATAEEMERANAVLRDYLKIAGLGTLLVLPGAPITIPLAVKLGKALGVNILPSEVEGEMT
ncbi:MAG TPA: cyclic nucleotide-binding domain-containing protein [Burkholderiales bacterium]|nr:cyclic nucleotide-binding domain-containing protein [Burkholderiales bacterium]